MFRVQLIILMVVVLLIAPLPAQKAFSQEAKTYRIAVLDLQPIGVSATEALALSEKLRSSLSQLIETGVSKDRYTLVERSQMAKIFEQFEIQNTGCTDIECAVEFGKMLSAERIVIGSVSLVGSTYMIIARIVDVESATTLRSVDKQHRGQIDDVISLMPLVSRELLTGKEVDLSATMQPITTQPILPDTTSQSVWLGIGVVELSSKIAAQYNLSGIENGVVIVSMNNVSLHKGNFISKLLLQHDANALAEGDVIIEIENKRVKNIADFISIKNDPKNSKKKAFLIYRLRKTASGVKKGYVAVKK